MITKLTLTIEDKVVHSAKKYALISYEQASKNKIWEFTADAANILRRHGIRGILYNT